jgi:hypothetical protein
MRNIILIATFLCISRGIVAQGAKGVCKGDKVPPERVIVGEFEGTCSPPDTMNAWDTVLPSDGLQVCQSTLSFESGANVLQFVLCEKVDSAKCPLRKDGTPNAYVLRPPAVCESNRAPVGKTLYKATELRLVCNTLGFDIREDEHVVAHTDNPQCARKPYIEGAKNAFVVERTEFSTPWIFSKPWISCVGVDAVAPNILGPPGRPPTVRPLGRGTGYYEVVTRRFKDSNCPPTQELNAVVMTQLTLHTSPSELPIGAIYCDGSPYWNTISSGDIERYFEHIYDGNCGGPDGRLNAQRVKRP